MGALLKFRRNKAVEIELAKYRFVCTRFSRNPWRYTEWMEGLRERFPHLPWAENYATPKRVTVILESCVAVVI